MSDKTPTQTPNTGEPLNTIFSNEKAFMASLEGMEEPNEKALIPTTPIETMQSVSLDQIQKEMPEREKLALMDDDALVPARAANEANVGFEELGGNVCGEASSLSRETPLTCTMACAVPGQILQEQGMKISGTADEHIVDADKDDGNSPKIIDSLEVQLGGSAAIAPLEAEQLQLCDEQEQPLAVAPHKPTKQMHSAPLQMVVTNGDPYYRDFRVAGYFGLPNAYHPELSSRIGNRSPDYFYTDDGSVHFYQPQYFEYLPEADENRTIIVSKTTDTSATNKPKNFN